MGLSYRLADAPPYLQTLHAERMERERRARDMHAELARASVAFVVAAYRPPPPPTPITPAPSEPAPVCSVPPVEPDETFAPTIFEIIRETSAHFLVSRLEILSHRRAASVVGPRQVAMYLAKKLTTHSLPSIGRHMGGKDHTSVIHAIKKISARRQIAGLTTDADCRAIAARLGASLD